MIEDDYFTQFTQLDRRSTILQPCSPSCVKPGLKSCVFPAHAFSVEVAVICKLREFELLFNFSGRTVDICLIYGVSATRVERRLRELFFNEEVLAMSC